MHLNVGAPRSAPIHRPRHTVMKIELLFFASLRERLAGEPWGPEAIALVEAEDAAIEPVREDLPLAVGQLRSAPLLRSTCG